MRIGRWLALCAALSAPAAGAQPMIVDPPDLADFELSIEDVVPNGLDAPGALVFLGDPDGEQFLIVEKNTGRVRHFLDRVEQALALDLAVDNCGDRGLIGIALHPNFDTTPTPETEPPTARPPDRDWVYVSYHTDAGRGSDGCDGDAVLRVERMMWTGTTLVPDPLVAPDPDPDDDFAPFETFERPVTSTTAVSGAIQTQGELQDGQFQLAARLYVAIGSGDRPADKSQDGALQNKKDATDPYDDTGVLMRLDENGAVPPDNPFDDPDVDELQPEDRYYTYGVRDIRGVAFDPVTSAPWFTEWSDDGFDELNITLPGTNGGYREYQGPVSPVPDNVDDDGEPNPDYPLFDVLEIFSDDPRVDGDPVSTYLNPRFSFEDGAVGPAGLDFGGVEVGPQHNGALFVGTRDGRLFRFPINAARSGFFLLGGLIDNVANEAVPEDPETEETEAKEADDLEQILIGIDFGEISYVGAGLDGSIYVVGRAAGAVYRVYYNATRDLAVSSVKVRKKIKLSAKKPVVTKSMGVTIDNVGERTERIFGVGATDENRVANLGQKLTNLLGITIEPAVGAMVPPGCLAPETSVEVPWYAQPPYAAIIGIGEGQQLRLEVAVTWECAEPFVPGATPYETHLNLDGSAVGIVEAGQTDEQRANDLCPRPATDDDPGCGMKKGVDVLGTELTLK